MKSSILLLDRDDFFRGTLASLLTRAGYQLVEASSATQAADLLSSIELGLAVVNFELPDVNGIEFISCLREAGINAPVVFLSERACDQQTFMQLRSILRVSLILQKPIEMIDLLQQVKSVLPAPRAALAPIRIAPVQAPVFLADSEHPAANRTNLGQQKPSMIKDLPMREFFALWTTLGRTLEIYQSDMHQMHLGQEAFKLIRAIRGRTADLELLRLSEVAAKIEGYVRLLDPHDAPGQRPVFAELFRLLSLGHEARNAYAAQAEVLIQEPPPRTVMQVPGQLGSDRVPAAPVGMPRGGREAVGQPSAARAGAVEAPQSPVHVGVVLLVGSEHTLQRSEGRSTSLIDAQIIFTTSAEEALSVIAAGKRVDEAVIDVSVTTVRGAIDLSRELRKRGLNDLLPIAFLCPPDYKVEPAERLIAGCSLVVAAPCTQQKFEDCMIRLSSLKNAKSNGNPAQPDEETGLLCERDFLIRTNTELINSGRSNREMVLCFIRLAETNQTALGASDPLIAPVIEKILRCSFPVETLRGRWADGFGLLFCNEDWHYVEQALKKWSQELAQVTVAASNGSRIPLYMDWSLGKYPLDGFSLDALLSAARSSGRSGAR